MIEPRALHLPTTELNLGLRVRKSVELMRARRLGDLCLLRADELWRWGASQEAAACEIRPGLARHGLAFRGEPTPDPAERERLDALLEGYVDELASALARDPVGGTEVPVAVLRLADRTRAWVRRREIYTVAGLLRSGDEDLWSPYSRWWHAYWEARRLPHEKRFDVGPPWPPAEHEALVDQIVRRLGSFGLTPERGRRWTRDRDRRARAIAHAAELGWDSIDIGRLELRARTVAYLKAAGILDVAHSSALTGKELMALLPDGVEGRAEVGAALADFGLTPGGGGGD